MKTSEFILGVIPPVMAIVAELLSPVAQAVIKPQLIGPSRQIARRMPSSELRQLSDEQIQEAEAAYETDFDRIATIASRTAVGASEVSALIPTWISVTAAFASILLEKVGPCWSIASVAAWCAVSGLIGIKCFSSLNYYDLSHRAVNWMGWKLVRADVLSWSLVGFNALTILIVCGFYYWN